MADMDLSFKRYRVTSKLADNDPTTLEKKIMSNFFLHTNYDPCLEGRKGVNHLRFLLHKKGLDPKQVAQDQFQNTAVDHKARMRSQKNPSRLFGKATEVMKVF